MKTEDRAAMINQMVAGLAARLEKDGKDLAGWQRLLRAYVVLGRKGDAASALASARRNFAGDEAALAELAQTAKSLGIGS
jgi:cytochrome c-type biogenesis protein CcmH